MSRLESATIKKIEIIADIDPGGTAKKGSEFQVLRILDVIRNEETAVKVLSCVNEEGNRLFLDIGSCDIICINVSDVDGAKSTRTLTSNLQAMAVIEAGLRTMTSRRYELSKAAYTEELGCTRVDIELEKIALEIDFELIRTQTPTPPPIDRYRITSIEMWDSGEYMFYSSLREGKSLNLMLASTLDYFIRNILIKSPVIPTTLGFCFDREVGSQEAALRAVRQLVDVHTSNTHDTQPISMLSIEYNEPKKKPSKAVQEILSQVEIIETPGIEKGETSQANNDYNSNVKRLAALGYLDYYGYDTYDYDTQGKESTFFFQEGE